MGGLTQGKLTQPLSHLAKSHRTARRAARANAFSMLCCALPCAQKVSSVDHCSFAARSERLARYMLSSPVSSLSLSFYLFHSSIEIQEF